jgi:tetratricopeptide (TPR) repeat protein
LLRKERGDRAGAKAGFQQLLISEPPRQFASVDAGLRGYKARHNLAVLHLEDEQFAEAESEWRSALQERPDFLPGWLGLGDLYLRRGAWPALQDVVGRLERLPGGAGDAVLFRARAFLARREFAAARQLLQEALRRWPQALGLRILLSHALLQEGVDLAAAEKALHDILELAPHNAEARHNLELLQRQQNRGPNAQEALEEAC